MADEPLLVLRPIFVGSITFLAQLPIQLFLTLWAGLFFGGLAHGLFKGESNIPFIICGAVAFFAVPAVFLIGKKLNYARTTYRFYRDRVEFEEGFFTINKKVIKYGSVREVTLRKGILQRLYGLGSVYLATLATGSSQMYSPFRAFGFGNVSASGLSVRDVPEPERAYDRIRSLVNAVNSSEDSSL